MSCYICLNDVDPELGQATSRCKCKGSIGVVHDSCWKEWSASQNSWKKYLCPICLTIMDNTEANTLPHSAIIEMGITISSLEVLRKAQWRGDYSELYTQVIENGNMEILQYMTDNQLLTDVARDGNIELAARHGHLHIVEFLHHNKKEGCTKNAMNYAARYGHLHIVEFLHQNRKEGCTTKAMDWAAMNGHLDIVRYLHYKRKEGCTTDAMDLANEYGHREVVEFSQENREEGYSTWSSRCC